MPKPPAPSTRKISYSSRRLPAGSASGVAFRHMRVSTSARCPLWANGEPGRDRVDLKVLLALLDAVEKAAAEVREHRLRTGRRRRANGRRGSRPPGLVRVRVLAEARLPSHRPTIAPPRYGAEGLPAELRETVAVHAAGEALRAARDQVDGGPGQGCRGSGLGARSRSCGSYARPTPPSPGCA